MREATWLATLCALGLTTALAACGDEEEPISPMTAQTTGATTGTMTTTSSGGGDGGAGQGGMGQGGMGQGGVGQGGMGTGGTGQGGGGGSAGPSLNGCADADFQPPGNPNNVVINFQSFSYTPKCLLIPPGTDVTFSGMGADPFVAHPLQAGTVVSDVATPDPSSPIQPTSSPGVQSVVFTFPSAGDFGYYCNLHFEVGMTGAIRVQ
jgi:plastocyanin